MNKMFYKNLMEITHLKYIYIVVLAVNILALTGDTVHSWTSPMFLKLNSTDPSENPLGKPMSESEQSLMGSIVYFGAIIGPFPFGILARKFGRKSTLLTIGIPHIISYAILSFAKNIYLYYFARFFSGLAMGGGYTVLPMYIAEIAEDCNRGSLSTTLNVFQTLGCFLPLAIGPYLSSFWFNILLTFLPLIFFVMFLLIGPETPYYLVSINDTEKAEVSLKLLRKKTDTDVKAELSRIEINIKNNECKILLSDLFKTRSMIKALIISISLVLAQQLSGFNAVLMYAQPIFIDAGSDLPSDICSVITGLVLFLSSFITPFLADRIGRRALLAISSLGIILSHAVFGIYFYINDNYSLNLSSVSWLPIVAILVYITTFNLGLGPLPWTISSELFPSNVKSTGASVTAFTCWLTSFLVTNYFAPLNHAIGKSGTFWFFGACCLLFLVFMIVFIPETKDKSFDEIQRCLGNREVEERTEEK